MSVSIERNKTKNLNLIEKKINVVEKCKWLDLSAQLTKKINTGMVRKNTISKKYSKNYKKKSTQKFSIYAVERRLTPKKKQKWFIVLIFLILTRNTRANSFYVFLKNDSPL